MIRLKDVCVDYPLDTQSQSLKEVLLSGFKTSNNISNAPKYYRAIDKLTLEINEGERVGIIGLNGAGKTTFLKLLSGIYTPSEGEINVQGRVSPILDFATGLELHHSGIENIRIRLMFLGESEASINELIDEIIDFADLGDFINLPARTYSAGMFMRLAFAISTAIKPEILIADEVVGAGDAQFAEKASKRIDNFLSRRQTSILSSHSMDFLNQFCDRVIWLHHGKIINDGSTSEVLEDYAQNATLMQRTQV